MWAGQWIKHKLRAVTAGKIVLLEIGRLKYYTWMKKARHFKKFVPSTQMLGYLVCAMKRVFPAGSQLALHFEECSFSFTLEEQLVCAKVCLVFPDLSVNLIKDTSFP